MTPPMLATSAAPTASNSSLRSTVLTQTSSSRTRTTHHRTASLVTRMTDMTEEYHASGYATLCPSGAAASVEQVDAEQLELGHVIARRDLAALRTDDDVTDQVIVVQNSGVRAAGAAVGQLELLTEEPRAGQ